MTKETSPPESTEGIDNHVDETVSTTIPSDLFSDAKPKEEELPLDEVVKEKPYASLSEDLLDTPTDTPPSPNGENTEFAIDQEEATGEYSGDDDEPTTPQPGIMGTGDLTPEEQQQQAEQTVKMFLKGYEKLHGIGRWYGKIDKEELLNLHSKGEIDLEQELPLGMDGQGISVIDCFTEYNDSIDDGISVSDEFKDDFFPPAVRVCIKNKWFLSDELTLIAMLSDDIATKAGLLVGLKKSQKMILDACRELKAQQSTPPKPSDQPPGEPGPEIETDGDWREPE